MADTTPIVEGDTLCYQKDGHEVRLMVGSADWYRWLESASTFLFRSEAGGFSARRERASNQRGGWYWRAYVRHSGQLHRCYLGKAEDLTVERLLSAVRTLMGAQEESSVAEEATVSRQPAMALLVTKLHMPVVRADQVTRKRLFEQLNRGLRVPLQLLTAPAGWGKTTLIAAWCEQLDETIPHIWVSLDSSDNDVTRFWSYVLAACNTVAPGCVAQSTTVLRASQVFSKDLLITTLLNELTVLETEIVLVLDDYHVITSHAIHDAMVSLLDHLPPQVHLVIASRISPPFPLARWRARGAMLELHAADLRFTAEECALFLRQSMGLALEGSAIEALEARTEGWIAGLQLAALAMRYRSNISEFIAAFTGTNRYIMDYLLEEVMQRQTPAVQSFLLATSVLERLCASLCAALLEQSEGIATQAMLERLEQENLFLISLDDERRWYRYHHLFAEVLRHRLQQQQPQRIALLHQRASVWYEQHNLFEEAIEHALAGSHYTIAGRLIEQVAQPVLKSQGAFSTLLRWMEALPQAWVRTQPQLCLLYAWALFTNRPQARGESEHWIECALQHHMASGQQGLLLLGEVAALRATMAAVREEYAAAIELSEQALTSLPANHWTRGLLSITQGAALLTLQDSQKAQVILQQAVEINQAEHAHQLVLVARSMLAESHILQGELRQAEHLYQETLQQYPTGGPPLRGVMLALGGMGELLREWNELERALAYLQRGVEMYAYMGGVMRIVLTIYLPLARVRLALGQIDEAFAALLPIENVARTLSSQYFAQLMAAWRARFRLVLNEISEVERWGALRGIKPVSKLEDLLILHLNDVEYMTWMRLALRQGRAINVLPVISHLLATPDQQIHRSRQIEALILQALAYAAIDQNVLALASLEQAIELAEGQGYLRLFVDEGPVMAALLSRLQKKHTGRSEYITTLLSAFPAEKVEEGVVVVTMRSGEQALLEPLSPRELEVLRLIARGASNDEIARELVITVSTVKRHVSNVFAKLIVKNRVEAVARARQLALL